MMGPFSCKATFFYDRRSQLIVHYRSSFYKTVEILALSYKMGIGIYLCSWNIGKYIVES